MDPISLLHARPKAWLANSVLAPHAGAFATYLTRARYSSQSCGNYVASLAHFGRWMSQCCLPLSQLDDERSSTRAAAGSQEQDPPLPSPTLAAGVLEAPMIMHKATAVGRLDTSLPTRHRA